MNRIADVPGEPKYPHARAQLSCRTCVFYQTHCLARCPSTDVDAASEDLDGAVIRRFAPYVRNRYVLGSPRGLRQRWAAESVCWTALHISACISHSASPHILAASAPFHLSSRRHTHDSPTWSIYSVVQTAFCSLVLLPIRLLVLAIVLVLVYILAGIPLLAFIPNTTTALIDHPDRCTTETRK